MLTSCLTAVRNVIKYFEKVYERSGKYLFWSRYLDDISNINNVNFDTTVSKIYPSELQLNKANTSDTKAAF